MGPKYNNKIISGANNKLSYLQNRSLETIPFSESPSPVATVGLKPWALKLPSYQGDFSRIFPL